MIVMLILTVLAAEFLIRSAVPYLVPALQTARNIPFQFFTVIH